MLEPDHTGRHLLLHGMSMVLVGLFWGLAVPKTPFPRIALSAHIQFEVNGLLYLLVGLIVLRVDHSLGRRSLGALIAAAWMTWPMLASAVANAWWGTKEMLPIAAAQAGATGGRGWQEAFVSLAHILGGGGLLVAWSLLLIGVARKPAARPSED